MLVKEVNVKMKDEIKSREISMGKVDKIRKRK